MKFRTLVDRRINGKGIHEFGGRKTGQNVRLKPGKGVRQTYPDIMSG
jgi:hypothetical protein